MAMTVLLTVSSYVAIVLSGYFTEILFGSLNLIPAERNALITSGGISFNYTSILNIIFIILAVLLVIRFYKTGGMKMLKTMKEPVKQDEPSSHHHNHDH